MASISSSPDGHRTIQFVSADKRRRSIRLGKMPMRTAEEVKRRVEYLAAAVSSGTAVDNDTAKWLASIGSELHARLAAVGLVQPRLQSHATLGEFLGSYIDGRLDVKGGTRTCCGLSRNRLIAFFGADRAIQDITEGDADTWLVFLKTKYAPATVGRTVRHAQQFFRAAVRRKLIAENPFQELKAPSQANTTRAFFVSRQIASQVLDACPDAEWRVIFALSRFGGLRCPSEHLSLEWSDVHWDKDRVRVRSPKKEHQADGGERWVPIFPELRPHLEAMFDQAEPGTVFVVNRYRNTNANLRTQLLRIMRRAGVKPWPRLFQNLRASRETELAESYPLHVVCEWIGNTARVAEAHYLQVTEEHYQRAAGGAESGAVSSGPAVQNPVQQPTAPVRTESQEGPNSLDGCDLVREGASPISDMRDRLVSRLGLEPRTYGLRGGGRDRTRTPTPGVSLCQLSYTPKSVALPTELPAPHSLSC
jgi:integrase